MTDSPSSDDETSSYSMIDAIDRICDEFEAEIRSGKPAKIEDYLSRMQPNFRNRLLRDLVAVEYEWTRRQRPVDFAEYYQRFPDSKEVLLRLKSELDSNESERGNTPAAQPVADQTIIADAIPKPQLRNFRLLTIAGSGGFCTVWRALDLSLQREVAVKIPRSDRADRTQLSALMREAQAAAKLKHPNIVSVHEVGEENGTSFIVTDYISGMNLREWRRKNAISYFDAARLIAKLALALQHAHANGVIHRDLKLANVLMDGDGEPHVADFGLAKREARDDSLAVEGRVLGTPAYMAPEQARADHQAIDRRTDVYSLGVMLYELITGTTPFRGDVVDLLQQILDVPPVAPRLIKPDLPRDLEAICLKCLSKDSAKRYDSALALADDLYLFLNGQTLRGIPAAMPSRVWKWFRRNRRSVITTTAAIILVASLSSGLIAWRYGPLLPKVPVHRVQFTTEPPGCEITVVGIDPETGEPDPTKIKTASGRTPLKLSLTGGDYLVVAVLDSQRFNEVFRHVPEPDDMVPFAYVHLKWMKQPSGVIEVPTIPIPRPDVSLGMAYCEGIEHLIEPIRSKSSDSRVWRLPAFYIDRREATSEDLKAWNVTQVRDSDKAQGPYSLQRYLSCVGLLEKQGKRLPTAAELYYLGTTICPPQSDHGEHPCVLNDNSTIEGIHSGVAEWTTTKPGGPFSGYPAIPKSLGIEATARMTGGFASDQATGQSPISFAKKQEHTISAGFRGVRSEKPRRTPQDFPKVMIRTNVQ